MRDDDALSPTEDLDRQPDGVPHDIIGLTVGFSVMFALLVCFMFAFGNTVSRVATVLIVAAAIPVLVKQLSRRAARERDHVHPSR